METTSNQVFKTLKKQKRGPKAKKVMTFCRPKRINFESDEQGPYQLDTVDNVCRTLGSKNEVEYEFRFDKVFENDCHQNEIFGSIGLPSINRLFKEQKDSLIFSYGVSGSGKTYTIIGEGDS